MNLAIRIAREEWRLWLRSKVVIAAALIIAVLLAATSVLTAARVADEQSQRLDKQVAAEEAFFSQPDRHPHRMVHYGHYAFRPPPPLAAFEPGVDAVTGQSIFLEGHRQNTAMFADTKVSADLGGFATLSPANLYQLLLPLLLIVLGHALFLRERESGTLAVLLALGQSGVMLAIGKGICTLYWSRRSSWWSFWRSTLSRMEMAGSPECLRRFFFCKAGTPTYPTARSKA